MIDNYMSTLFRKMLFYAEYANWDVTERVNPYSSMHKVANIRFAYISKDLITYKLSYFENNTKDLHP